jgi:hypothetical protein
MFSDDDWDSIVNLESTFFEEGRVDGAADAISEGLALEDGLQAGLMRGLAIGLEIGFYEQIAQRFLARCNDEETDLGDEGEFRRADGVVDKSTGVNDSNEAESLANSDGQKLESSLVQKKPPNSINEPLPLRTRKRYEEILRKCRDIPSLNDDAYDFEREIHELRGLYKACSNSGLIGPFIDNIALASREGRVDSEAGSGGEKVTAGASLEW